MNEQWMIYNKRADFKAIAGKYSIDQVTARIMRNRGLVEDMEIEKYLKGTFEDCYPPELMKDLDKAVDMILNQINEKKKIRIIGDYDVDGVCSSYILVKGLRAAGAWVDAVIPHRIRDGYGINIQIIEQAAEEKITMLLTCDNGISACSQIAYARSLGMKVIVTDHHDIPYDEEKNEVIPPADAVVNPKQSKCTYPFKGLCGAGVALKLTERLFQRCGIPEEELSVLIEAAALATVADVMKLQDENRILVREGLRRMRDSKNQGLKALIEQCRISPESISSYHLGFVIGPCLNAGGRLDTAKKALELLLSEEKAQAELLAAELRQLNEQRKDMTVQGVEQAETLLEEEGRIDDSVYVVYLPGCHESLAGIIAGRLREKYNHPTFVLTNAEQGVKGSGRSIEAYSMYDALTECRELLNVFGGHPMAAGLSLPAENVESFRKKLNECSLLKPEDFHKKVWIDVPMPFSYVTERLIEEFSLLEPFGNGNEKPLFAQKNLKVQRLSIIGKNKNVVKLILSDEEGNTIDGVLFHDADRFMEEVQKKYPGQNAGIRLSVTYYPSVNEYNGQRKLQMVIQNFMVQ